MFRIRLNQMNTGLELELGGEINKTEGLVVQNLYWTRIVFNNIN